MMVNTLFLIPVDKRRCLIMIHVKTFLYRFLIIIATTALLSAKNKTLHQFFLRYIKFNHCSDFVSTLSKHFLQSFCLRNRTWEAIKNDAFVFFAKTVINTCKNINHKLIWNKLTLVYITFGCFPEFCTVLNFITQHITCRNMLETILSDHLIALRALA